MVFSPNENIRLIWTPYTMRRRKKRKEKDGGDKLRDLALGLHQDMLETTKENKK